MTKEELVQTEKAQQNIWKDLIETGDNLKPSYVLHAFYCGCPACEIAYCTWYRFKDKEGRCKYCPVKEWRVSGRETPSCQSPLESSDDAENHPDIEQLPLYAQWLVAGSGYCIDAVGAWKATELRKEYAEEISKLTFDWIDVYEETTLTKTAVDYLKGLLYE